MAQNLNLEYPKLPPILRRLVKIRLRDKEYKKDIDPKDITMFRVGTINSNNSTLIYPEFQYSSTWYKIKLNNETLLSKIRNHIMFGLNPTVQKDKYMKLWSKWLDELIKINKNNLNKNVIFKQERESKAKPKPEKLKRNAQSEEIEETIEMKKEEHFISLDENNEAVILKSELE